MQREEEDVKPNEMLKLITGRGRRTEHFVKSFCGNNMQMKLFINSKSTDKQMRFKICLVRYKVDRQIFICTRKNKHESNS